MRPRRIYKEGNRFFYIINGKRRYIKIKEDVTEKQIVRANLKRIEKPDQAKRVKPRTERKQELQYRFEQPIVNGEMGLQLSTPNYYNPFLATRYPSASTNLVEQGKKITSIEDIITGAERKKKEKFGENIVDFFSALASKKNELFANFTMTQSPTTLTKPVAADTTKDNIDVSSKDTELPYNYYKASILDTINSFEDFADLWRSENPSYSDMIFRIINQQFRELEGNEDRKKKLFVELKNDEQLKDIFDSQVKKVQEVIGIGGIPIRVPQRDFSRQTPISKLVEMKEEGVLQESKGEEPSSSSLPPIEPTRPKYQKPGGKKPFLKSGEGTLASSGVKPLTTEEKLATTPSYSGTPQGTEAPAEPLRDVPTSSPMAVSYVEQLRKEMGFGEYESNNGLYNDEIAKIIRKRIGRIIPVVPSDKVNDLLSYVVKGDKKFAAVINTNPSQSDGSGGDGYRPGHWRGIFIDCRDDFPSCEYFDPLAEGKPEKSLVDVMKKICKKMNPEKLCLFKSSSIRRQAKEKSTCGWHVVQYIDDRWRGIPWSEATGYDNYIEKLKEPVDDSKDGEKEVEKYIKKYEVYI